MKHLKSISRTAPAQVQLFGGLFDLPSLLLSAFFRVFFKGRFTPTA